MMTALDVIDVLDRVERSGVRVWLDGGWGVEALLGEQTRPHDDLDLVAALDDADRLVAALASLGYALHEDERPTRFVLRAPDDRRIDVHTVTFDTAGGGIQVLQGGTPWRYPPEGFAGTGVVDGRAVPCLSVEVQVLCHLGYEPDETDRRDMRALHDRLGVALPAPFDLVGDS